MRENPATFFQKPAAEATEAGQGEGREDKAFFGEDGSG
jgi:hypothetical protein